MAPKKSTKLADDLRAAVPEAVEIDKLELLHRRLAKLG
jgi:hypothetical protein